MKFKTIVIKYVKISDGKSRQYVGRDSDASRDVENLTELGETLGVKQSEQWCQQAHF